MQNRLGMRIALTTLALVMAGGATARAHAQYVAEFTPFFTSYYPLAKIDFTGSTDELFAKQGAAPGVGARLTFWLSRAVGIEAAGSFQWSKPQIYFPDPDFGPVTTNLKGTLLNATGRFVYRPARTNMFLLAGGGIVSRGGEAWEGDDIKRTDLAGVAGFGARANITPKFAVNVVVEGTFYPFDADGPDADGGTFFQSSLQSDINVSIGIPIGFGRR
jgi:hypothetical protein